MVNDYPDCKHRVDTKDIESKMRGEKIGKHKAELAGLCRKLYDECIKDLENCQRIINNLRDSLCDKEDE